MKKLTDLATLAGAMVLGPAAIGGISDATAATISYDSAGALHYQAAPGETNQPSFQGDSGTLLIVDADGVRHEDRSGTCRPGYVDYIVECPMPGAIDADLGDGADRASAGSGLPAGVALTVRGGDGADKLKATLVENRVGFDGGAGNDELIGGESTDTLAGGPGEDTIDGRGAADTVLGGDGNDLLAGDGHNTEAGADLIDGGPGYDRIESEWGSDSNAAPPPLSVSIDAGADDGRAGEGDDVRGIEFVYVTESGSFTGTDGPEHIRVHQVTGPSTLRGNGGDDTLDASDGTDRVDGGAGNDELDGGFGDDEIVGGPGADRLHGDTPGGECSYIYCKNAFGNDTIQARDGEVVSVDCGVGTDRVVADRTDVVAPDCETVERPGEDDDEQDEVVPPDPRKVECVVPKLKGLKQRAAEKRLRAAGCRVAVKRARSRTVARGRVIKSSRRAGARVASGSKVTITVSRGR